MINGVAEAAEERPWTVLVVVGLITVLMTYGVTQISMSSDMEDFLPQNYTSVRVTEEVENETGGTINELVLVKGEDLTSAGSFRTIVNFQRGLEERFDRFIQQIQSYPGYLLPHIENYPKISDSELESRIDFLLSYSGGRSGLGEIISSDRKATLIIMLINSDLSYSKLMDKTGELHEYTENFDENSELSFSNTGSLSMEKETSNMMNRDNMILIPSAILIVIFILYFTFRRFSDVGLPFLVLGLGAYWMVGFMGLIGLPFTMIYVALVPVMLGVGIDYTIHMLNRYYEERGEGLPVEESAVQSVKTVGVAVALTAVTTIIGFASFGVSDLPPLRNFGLLAGSGVLFIFVLATVMLPSLLVLRDRGGGEKEGEAEEGSDDRAGKVLSRINLGAQRYKKPIIIGTVIVTAICFVSSFGLSTTMSYDQFLPEDAETVSTMEEVENRFGGQSMRAFVLVRGDVLDPDSLRVMGNLEEAILNDPRNKNLITDSSSLTGLVLRYNENKIPPDREGVENAVDRFVRSSEQGKRILLGENETVMYFSIGAERSEETKRALRIIRSHVDNFSNNPYADLDFTFDGDPAVGGGPAILSDIMDSIIPSMRNSIILAVVLVVIILGLVFRSPSIGLMGSLPVVLALFWEFGVIRGLGWSLDVMNMMVSALAIGIGVDFTIHMTHRFREEWKGNGKSPEESIATAVRSVGRAILAAAATTIGVFFVLSLSRMPPIGRFGQLAGMVIFFALVGALVVLPSVLLAYANWKERSSNA